jgi:hypothetical protein
MTTLGQKISRYCENSGVEVGTRHLSRPELVETAGERDQESGRRT